MRVKPKSKPHKTTTEVPILAPELVLNNHRPKRKKIGECEGHTVFQLEESTGCLDCFRSIPSGSIVTLQNVATNMCKIPVCMYFAGLDPSSLTITDKVEKSCQCSCPSFADGSAKHRAEYAKKVRSFKS